MQSDLVHSGEFVPGYSSFLFNQLLQTQFYSVNHGGRSINLNLSNPLSPPLSTIPDHPNIPRAVLVEEHITPILSPRLPPQNVSVNNTSNNSNSKPNVNNNGNNNNSVNNSTNSTSAGYKSIVFQQALADQQKKYNRKFERDVRVHVPVYPEIDLLESFGEREIVRRNKRRLQSLLYSTRCNLDVLRLQASKYVPSDMRPMTWQLLFNYLPPEKVKRESVLLEKQKKYADMLAHATAQREELTAQIDMDVLRTMPEGHEVLFGNPAVKQALARVLLVWAVHHPATGYFQGLNDLASPFLYSFLSHHSTYQVGRPRFFYNQGDGEEEGGEEESDERRMQADAEFSPGLLQRVEADVYWCLCSVMDSVEHLNAHSKCGVHGEIMMSQLEALIKMIDAPLDAHMKHEKLEYVHFSFPWMLCLFVREVSLDLLLVLWDFYATHPQGLRHAFSVMHVYICAAFLLRFRNDIIRLEFPEMLKFLHRPPTKGWTTYDMYDLISHASALYESYPLP
eukprot:Phypoly_transcript_04756.p1 GENE.Phypoly_transcript_04756~~Phypoly_transcript_04756.p1  ORF type:complete len:508 (+),score=75.92 Phypoly_transcript_04756:526-2049(+)